MERQTRIGEVRSIASFTKDGKDNEGEVIVNLYGEKFEIRREAV